METTFQKIVRKTGMKPVECKCSLCKSQCKEPCLGTPQDMFAISDAGFGTRLEPKSIEGKTVIAPKFDKSKQACTFFTNGLCELHDLGLKPTVGKLSHHSVTYQNFNPKKSIHKFVMAEW